MNAEQKQRATELVAGWRGIYWRDNGNLMAALLQELIDAPEAEPVAVIHLDGSFVHVEFKQPIAGTGKFEVYAAPPVPSLLDDVARDAERYRWLRNQNNSLETQQRDKGVINGLSCYHEVEGIRELKYDKHLDCAVDAAIERGKLKGGA